MPEDQIDPGAWYRPASLQLSEYDERWPELYEHEAALLRAAIGSELSGLEHIGSTAVPGMAAKPILDILAAVGTWERFDQIVPRLEELGYVYTPESEGEDAGRRVFRKGPDDMSLLRTHHLHMTETNSRYWKRMIAFRDQLRSDPVAAADYAALKRRLIVQFETDSRAYTDAKSDFVSSVERR